MSDERVSDEELLEKATAAFPRLGGIIGRLQAELAEAKAVLSEVHEEAELGASGKKSASEACFIIAGMTK